MVKDNISQEKIYENLNKVIDSSLKIIKRLLWPTTIIFVIVIIIWGVDIYKMRSELKVIQQTLNIDVKEIELARKEANLKLEENQKILIRKLESIDSTFNILKAQYNLALKQSNTELENLRKNTQSINEFSNLIRNNTNTAIQKYREAQQKYIKEIQYASSGAEQRKNEMDNIFKENRVLLLKLADILVDFKNYMNEKSAPAIVTEDYDDKKINQIDKQLSEQLSEFKKLLEQSP